MNELGNYVCAKDDFLYQAIRELLDQNKSKMQQKQEIRLIRNEILRPKRVISFIYNNKLDKSKPEDVKRFEIFVSKFADYLNHHGERANKELDITSQRQIEDCSFILNIATSKQIDNSKPFNLDDWVPKDSKNETDKSINEEKLCDDVIEGILSLHKSQFTILDIVHRKLIRRFVKVFRNCFRFRESPKYYLIKLLFILKRALMQINVFIYQRLYGNTLKQNPTLENCDNFVKEFEKSVQNSKISQNFDCFSFTSLNRNEKTTNAQEIIQNCCSFSDAWWESYGEEEKKIYDTVFYLFVPEMEFILNNIFTLTDEQVSFFKNLIDERRTQFAKDMSTNYDYRVFDLKTQEITGFFFCNNTF